MNKRDAEIAVRTIVQSIKNGHKPEDSFVELKFEMDHGKSLHHARQLAGLANAARDEDVLWVVGIDEKTGQIRSQLDEEVSQTFDRILKHFKQTRPELKFQVNIHLEDGSKSVVAIVFSTDRSPYQVPFEKDENKLEIPWRYGTRTRSAEYPELLTLLQKRESSPSLEVREAALGWRVPDEELSPNISGGRLLEGHASLFINYHGHSSVFLDEDRFNARIDGYDAKMLRLSIPRYTSGRVQPSIGGIEVHGSGSLLVEILAEVPSDVEMKDGTRFELEFYVVEIQDFIVAPVSLKKTGNIEQQFRFQAEF
ncbi:hypothetical protein Pan216_16040 [Planctomycetes bacterium Pan216]|uniref:Divergent AAA domain protein n=1 Tax=Kolteria novifilia TaxID=2527975 RepID=A0A518B198_9BACT|nr:hypothetical protein Pan216_16040 [Planctomycetes bacterium Pan216]